MQNNPSPGNDPGLPSRQELISALLDAQDNIGWARSLIEALERSESRATSAVAHHAHERLENALAIISSLMEAVK